MDTRANKAEHEGHEEAHAEGERKRHTSEAKFERGIGRRHWDAWESMLEGRSQNHFGTHMCKKYVSGDVLFSRSLRTLIWLRSRNHYATHVWKKQVSGVVLFSSTLRTLLCVPCLSSIFQYVNLFWTISALFWDPQRRNKKPKVCSFQAGCGHLF